MENNQSKEKNYVNNRNVLSDTDYVNPFFEYAQKSYIWAEQHQILYSIFNLIL